MENEKMMTVKMSRHDMCRIQTALTCVMYDFEKGTASREMWERIRNDFISQFDAPFLPPFPLNFSSFSS